MTATATVLKKPARTLAPRYYVDPGHHALELEKVFARTWQYACHGAEIAEPGSYATFRIGDQGLFVIRGEDGRARAFYNVCRHRAHELLRGAGRVRRNITCPYHAWTYDPGGGLVRAPHAERTPGFDASKIRLTEVRVESLCGFLFVNLDPEAAPMSEWYPGVEEELRAFLPGIDGLRPLLVHPVEEDCNWKVSVENYSECYHCRVAHPTLSTGVMDPADYRITAQGYCLKHAAGCAPPERMSYEADTEAVGYCLWYLWPAFAFQVYPGGALNTYLWRPEGVEKVVVHRGWYTGSGLPEETVRKLAQQDLDTTVAEDLGLVNSVQRGLRSKGYAPGPLVLDPDLGVNSEHSIRTLNRWLLKALDV